jgi:large subunit ribosomal protein L30
MSNTKQVKVTLVRSVISAIPKHKATVLGLGLRRIRHSVILADNACTRGMINKVSHLLLVEEA